MSIENVSADDIFYPEGKYTNNEIDQLLVCFNSVMNAISRLSI